MREGHDRSDGTSRMHVSSSHALLTRASDGFTERLGLVRPHQWAAPTPCADWDVQALVNHVVGANLATRCCFTAPRPTRSTPPARPTI
jgi:hypothetical protein